MLTTIINKLTEKQPEALLHVAPEDLTAAVLIPIVKKMSSPTIVLTKRAEHLNSHSGQVAFPGGKLEPQDADLMQTALRETHEEIDLHPTAVEVISELPPYYTHTYQGVVPFVGLVEPEYQFYANPDELDAVFEVPVEFLANPENLTRFPYRIDGMEYGLPCYRYHGFTIWGFTLAILVGFLNYTLNAGLVLQYPPEYKLLSRRHAYVLT
ncbi:MAG: CoA pyrophosphatase [bacterium]